MLAPRIGSALAALVFAAGSAHAAEGEIAGPSLGVALMAPIAPATLVAKDVDHPIDVRVTVAWADVERTRSEFDWSPADALVGSLASQHARVTLCVTGESSLHPRESTPGAMPGGDWLDAWTALLRSGVSHFGPEVAVVEIGDRPERSFDAGAYAFVLKASALAVKAEAKARGIEIRVAQGAVGSDALAWQTALWDNDAAPYVDVLPVAFDAGADVAQGVAAFSREAALHPPAAELRADVAADDQDPWAAFRGAVGALAASARTALVALPAEADRAEPVARVVASLQSRLAAGYAPAPLGGLALRSPAGGPAPGASIAGRFLHAKDFATLVVYQASPTGTPDDQARLLLDTIDVKEPAVVDLSTGASFKTGPAAVPGEKARALRLLLADHPLAVVWGRASENEPGLDVAAEDVKVATTRGLTAEEIIARNRQVQKIQDDRLLRWTAKGRVDLHFKIAQSGGSIDVGIDSMYFWRRGGALEWQQTHYYVNGNRLGWKKIPQLPLIQPEKVATLPLDLTFDKTYDYALAGDDVLGGRAAYVVAFEPSAALAGKSLYRGRVWIDKESFVRLRTSVIQTNLESPILQNEETDTYVPLTGPDGATYILIGRVDGQQLWSGGGRNFVVRRELVFTSFNLNGPQTAFDAALQEAYASDDQVLRDTERGYRYLKKDESGNRVVQESNPTDALFALAGAVKDSSTSGVLPLLGVNWFDYDLLKKNIQINVFFAGIFAYVNITDPSVGGSKVDLGGEVSLVGFKSEDRLYVDGTEDLTQRVDRRSQYLTGRAGYPLGNFFKLAAIADFTLNRYSESSDAEAALAGSGQVFVPPVDHQVLAGTLQLEFNRMGYSVTAAGSYSHRSSWERWGLFDTATATFLDTTFDPSQQTFETWKLTAFKEWYLPKFQKLKLEFDYLDGSHLDRFSQYRFGMFGDESLVGFSGTGVRFDTGWLGRGGWAFNIANAIRFDVSVETAHVKDGLADDRYRDHTGIGLSGNVPGPWTTIWQFSYGRALLSDIPELRGKQEFRLVVLKLFPSWRQGRKHSN